MDKLEKEIPAAMVMEWNEYLNWELEQITRAILSAIPAARSLMGGRGGSTRLSDPAEIAGLFDALGAKTNG